VADLASMDFFTVSTLTGRLLFVFVLLAHDRRRILHVNCTDHPTAAWTAHQAIEALPENLASYLHGHSGISRASSRHSGGKGRLPEERR
jgi:hypothetical protein